MVTPTLSPPKTYRPWRILAKSALVLLAFAVVLIGTTGVWIYMAARAALPQMDGTIQVAGLKAPVTVMRDAQGVPHITASSMEDLLFAQGYVTAQDRLWQMDIQRRYAAGEVSEVLGGAFLRHDREQRILGLRTVCERALGEYSERDRSYAEAYARGVNAYIASHQNRLPIEFRLGRYRPRPWTPADSLLVGANLVKELNFYHVYEKLWREKVQAKLPPDLVQDLYVRSSWRDHPPGQDGGEIQVGPETSGTEETEAAAILPGVAGSSDYAPEFVLGSNNWVVSGAHTASGKPLLSGDPHLGHQVPSLWYEAHLHAGDFDVAGVTLPGLPYVILGHNRRIAWGMTNIDPSVADLYVETFNERGEYQTAEGWRQPARRREVIKVKGKPDVVFDVRSTRHGPIISELFPGENRELALRWAIYDPHGVSFPFYELDAAQNWDEFRRALAEFPSPGQNLVYGDVDGHIGYQATGMVPIRASGDGSVPEPGGDNTHEWTGFLPFDKLPSVFDPPSGILATANGRITPDGYPYLITDEWGAPYRTERIYRVLQSGKLFTPADMLNLQMDIYSELDRFCAERFVYAVDHANNPSARVHAAAELMRGWNGRVEKSSAAAALAANARYQLVKLLLEPRLGAGSNNSERPEGWQQYRWAMWPVWLENVMLRQPAKWLPPNYSDYIQLLTAAVEAAVDPKNGAPKDLKKWTWGKEDRLRLQHPMLGAIPILNHWSGPRPLEQSGSSFCVDAASQHAGPSERMTVDFSNLDNSTLNIVLGESGNIFSRHYMDQFAAWAEGRTYALPFSEEAVQKARKHQLTLAPGR